MSKALDEFIEVVKMKFHTQLEDFAGVKKSDAKGYHAGIKSILDMLIKLKGDN